MIEHGVTLAAISRCRGFGHATRRRSRVRLMAAVAGAVAVLGGLLCPTGGRALAEPATAALASGAMAAVGASGLPLPRYVSLKSSRVNLRSGPGTEYPTAWVYRRAGLPVEVIEEFDAWRKVRDAEGTVGWILQSLLSGRRTALILPWEVKQGQPVPQATLRSSDSERSPPVVIVEANVIADVQSCDGVWCYVHINTYRGYIEQKKLWGIYEREVLK